MFFDDFYNLINTYLKKFAIIMAAIVAGLLIVAAMKRWPPVLFGAEPGYLTNTPGEIQATANGDLQGSFMLEIIDPDTSSVKNVQSQGTGGACYIADLQFTNYPHLGTQTVSECRTNLDCREPKIDKLPNGWQGYCAHEAPTLPSETSTAPKGRCWIRPGIEAAYCRRSADPDRKGEAWPLLETINLHPISPVVTADGTLTGTPLNPKKIKWRVHTCLNQYNSAGSSPADFPGCQDSTSFHRDGTIYPQP